MTMLDDDVKTKSCATCHEIKSVDEFYTNPRSASGYGASCKECEKIHTKTRYQERKNNVAIMTRADRFLHGILEAKELTKEELIGNFIYLDDGTKYDCNSFERRAKAKFEAELTRRLNSYIREKSSRAVEVIFEIADSDLVEPADRLKAAQWLAERVIGKTPDVVQLSVEQKPYETVFENLDGGSREAYRAKALESGNILEAEIVEDSQDDGMEEDGDEPIPTVEDQSNVEKSSNSGARIQPDESGSYSDAEAIVKKKREAQELQKRISDAKKRRFAARAVGASSVAGAPWLIDWRVTQSGLSARLVAPTRLTPGMMEKIRIHEEQTSDPIKVFNEIANMFSKKAKKYQEVIQNG